MIGANVHVDPCSVKISLTFHANVN